MVMLSTLDFVLIFVYFAVLLLIGYFSSRRQDDEDYLIAGRNLGVWSTMATVNASKTGAILMTFVALVYLWGFSAIWYFVGMVIGILAFIPFALRLKDNSKDKFYTLADYFKYNYGKKSAIFASLLSIFMMFGFLVINLIAGTKLFVFFSGWSFWLCATIMMFIVLSYLLMGGFKAVVKTDVLQYIAIAFILVVLALLSFSGSFVPSSEWNLFSADTGTLAGFLLAGFLFPFAMPELWQRVYSSRSKTVLKKGLLLSSFVYAIFAFLLALIALTVKVKFPGVDPDLALIYGFANLLPTGLLGLSVVLLFAAVMSSLDTYIFTGASAIVHDFFDWDKKKTVRNIRKVIFALAVIGTIVSVLIQSLIIGSYLFVAMLVVLAVPVIATWINRSIKQRTLLWGFSLGVLGFVSFLIMNISEVTPMIVVVAIASTLVGLGIGGVVSLFKK